MRLEAAGNTRIGARREGSGSSASPPRPGVRHARSGDRIRRARTARRGSGPAGRRLRATQRSRTRPAEPVGDSGQRRLDQGVPRPGCLAAANNVGSGRTAGSRRRRIGPAPTVERHRAGQASLAAKLFRPRTAQTPPAAATVDGRPHVSASVSAVFSSKKVIRRAVAIATGKRRPRSWYRRRGEIAVTAVR